MKKAQKEAILEPIGALSGKKATVLGYGALSRSNSKSGQNLVDAYVEIITAPLDEQSEPVFEKAQVDHIHVALIPLYQVRSVWNEGKPIGINRNIKEIELSLEIGINDRDVRQLGLFDESKSWFEKTSNTAFQKLRISRAYKLQTIYNGRDVSVFIPCTTILSFYWKSSYLITQAFSGERITETLYNPERSRLNSPSPYVQLRKKAEDILAPHIARLALCQIATKRYESIHPNSFHLESPPAIWAIPPFNGSFRWKAEAYVSKDFIYVTRIISCSAPFNFSTLEFGRDNDGRTPKDRPKPKTRKYIKKPSINNIENDKLLIKTTEPSTIRAFTALLALENYENPFPKLSASKISKIEKLEILDPNQMNISIYEDDELADFLAPSDWDNLISNRNAKLEIIENIYGSNSIKTNNEINGENNYTFDTFIRAMDKIGSDGYEWAYILFDEERKHNGSLYENLIPFDEQTKSSAWIYLPVAERGKTIETQIKTFVLCEVRSHYHYIYIAEFSQRKNATVATIVFGNPGSSLSRLELEDEIRNFVCDRRRWRKNKQSTVGRRIDHIPRETADAWSIRIKACLKYFIARYEKHAAES